MKAIIEDSDIKEFRLAFVEDNDYCEYELTDDQIRGFLEENFIVLYNMYEIENYTEIELPFLLERWIKKEKIINPSIMRAEIISDSPLLGH